MLSKAFTCPGGGAGAGKCPDLRPQPRLPPTRWAQGTTPSIFSVLFTSWEELQHLFLRNQRGPELLASPSWPGLGRPALLPSLSEPVGCGLHRPGLRSTGDPASHTSRSFPLAQRSDPRERRHRAQIRISLKIAAWRCPLAERDSHQIICPGHGFPERLHSTNLAQDPGQGEEETPRVGRHADSGSAFQPTRTECLREASV